VVFLGAFTRELRGYLIYVFLIAQFFSLSLKRGKLQGVTGEYLERSAIRFGKRCNRVTASTSAGVLCSLMWLTWGSDQLLRLALLDQGSPM